MIMTVLAFTSSRLQDGRSGQRLDCTCCCASLFPFPELTVLASCAQLHWLMYERVIERSSEKDSAARPQLKTLHLHAEIHWAASGHGGRRFRFRWCDSHSWSSGKGSSAAEFRGPEGISS